MKITLKKLHISNQLSAETIAFTADVYADNKLIGYAKNDGQGGCTFVNREYANRDIFEAAEKYCKELPSTKYMGLEIPKSLDSIVDELVYAEYNKKVRLTAEKKLKTNMKKGLCVGTVDNYNIISWKKYTLENVLKFSNGIDVVKEAIKKYGKENILNTNLPKECYE